MILFNLILFYLFYYTHDVVNGYAVDVLCCSWTLLNVLAGGTANFIINFDDYVIVIWCLLSLGQMFYFEAHFNFFLLLWFMML